MLREERQADNAKLIEASSLSIASATLQKVVKEIILGSGGTIKSQRINKMEDFGPFKVITVSIDTEIPDAGVLGDILYSIETSTPYIVVKELDVRVRKARVRRGKQTEQDKLTIKLDLSALSAGK